MLPEVQPPTDLTPGHNQIILAEKGGHISNNSILKGYTTLRGTIYTSSESQLGKRIWCGEKIESESFRSLLLTRRIGNIVVNQNFSQYDFDFECGAGKRSELADCV